jgi:hypothetical protein
MTNTCTRSWDYVSFNERSSNRFVSERVKQQMRYNLVRKPGAGKPHARFDERDVKTDQRRS